MVYFAIAERLGCTVRALLECIDARELAEWQVYLGQDYWRERVREKMETPEQKRAKLKALIRGTN